MADFIELNELYENKEGYTDSVKRVFNKALITEIFEDIRHSQTIITYEGKEVRVKEKLQEINSKSAE